MLRHLLARYLGLRHSRPLISFPLGELRLLRDVGIAFEKEPVAVRIGQRGHPHRIPDEGLLRLDAARGDLAIDRQSVPADEADGDALPHLSFRYPGGVPLLQHQGGLALLEPAPPQLALIDPLLGHRKAEAVDVPEEGPLDIGDEKERYGLLDVGFRCHGPSVRRKRGHN